MPASAHADWPELTLYGLLVRAAERWPDHEGLVSPRERLTYGEMLARVHELAWGLILAGVDRSDRVATLFGTRTEWVVLHYAVSCLGATLVPLNTRLQAAELHYALAKAGATVLVTMDRDGSRDLLPRVLEARTGLPGLRLSICHSPAGRRYEGWLDLTLLPRPVPARGRAGLRRRARAARPDDLALVMFTSGSTSLPKAVMLSHRSLIGHAYYLSRALALEPADRYLNILPFFHIAGYTQGVLLNHYAGSTLYLTDSFQAEEILGVIVEARISAWAGMPVTIQRTLDLAQRRGADLSSLRKQHGVSPELRARVCQETRATLLTRMYGLTESAGLVSVTPLEEQDPQRRAASVGAPLPGVSVRIADPATNEELPRGEAGEITFRGWNCFLGYLDDPEITAATIDSCGYCHTGDRGYLDERGWLHLLGRYKDVIKSGGENVSAAEVETWLREHIPGIRAVSVIGVPDDTWGEAVTAIFEPEPAANLGAEAIRSCCRGHLASFKVPRHVLLAPPAGWPLTASGKIDKQRLRQWAMAQLATRQGGARP